MIRHKSSQQLNLSLFESPFERGLSPTNRWVELAEALPWDRLAGAYYRRMSTGHGSPCKDGRVVVGAVIIKHKLKLSDREVIEQVRENPYLQYLLGFDSFKDRTIFHPSLFPKIRARLGMEEFEAMNKEILVMAGLVEDDRESGDGGPETAEDAGASPADEDNDPGTHKGKLLIDAVVTDQMIKYPTDLDLLNDSRRQAERLIDLLYEHESGKLKPRTYRKRAHKDFLTLAKQKKKSKSALRKGIRKQLGYLRRDLAIIEAMLGAAPHRKAMWSGRDEQIHHTIGLIYVQQKQMYDDRVHTCKDRIVSIYQPWVRPMVTGKAFPRSQFGPKTSVSLIDGFASVHRVDWNNFNEGEDLIPQVEAYKARHGYYPEAVVADQKYGTRANRKWLKENGMRFSGKALGRPKKNPTAEDLALKKLTRSENGMRSQIEGKFGQGKNGYGMRKCRAKLQNTTESWLCAIFFTMNLVKFFCLDWIVALVHAPSRASFSAIMAWIAAVWDEPIELRASQRWGSLA